MRFNVSGAQYENLQQLDHDRCKEALAEILTLNPNQITKLSSKMIDTNFAEIDFQYITETDIKTSAVKSILRRKEFDESLKTFASQHLGSAKIDRITVEDNSKTFFDCSGKSQMPQTLFFYFGVHRYEI